MEAREKRRLAGMLLEVLYPGICLVCGQPLLFAGDPPIPVCDACLASLDTITCPRRCRVCSLPLLSEDTLCTRCRQRSFHFELNHSLYEYRGIIREIISQFKFSHRRSLAPLLAGLLYRTFRQPPWPSCPLSGQGSLPAVPVPGSPAAVRRRGWDPMLEVARALKSNHGVPVLSVLRRRAGKPQKGLDYEERLRNLRGTLEPRNPKAALPDSVVLLDDIFTTGATADECARVLREQGVRRVYVSTLAID